MTVSPVARVPCAMSRLSPPLAIVRSAIWSNAMARAAPTVPAPATGASGASLAGTVWHAGGGLRGAGNSDPWTCAAVAFDAIPPRAANAGRATQSSRRLIVFIDRYATLAAPYPVGLPRQPSCCKMGNAKLTNGPQLSSRRHPKVAIRNPTTHDFRQFGPI